MFHENLTDINHQNPTRFSQNNFAQRKIKLSRTKFAISSRGSRLWNNIITPIQKQYTSQNSFKKSTKETLLKLCNELDYLNTHLSETFSKRIIHIVRTQEFSGGSINNLLICRCMSPCQGVRNVAFLGGIVEILSR